MSAVITVEEAQANLKEIIHRMAPGDQVVLTENQQPVAKLVCEQPQRVQRPAPGLGKGFVTIVTDDDEHLKDFAEYMP